MADLTLNYITTISLNNASKRIAHEFAGTTTSRTSTRYEVTTALVVNRAKDTYTFRAVTKPAKLQSVTQPVTAKKLLSHVKFELSTDEEALLTAPAIKLERPVLKPTGANGHKK